jgi:hypothetical protein
VVCGGYSGRMSTEVRVKTVPHEVLEVKSRGPLGQATAVFSRFNVVDLDGDVTVPGAIRDGAKAAVSAYNHASVVGAMLPAGRATIRTDAEVAIAEVEFFMTTDLGRTAFETVRELGELGEWSYAYKILDAAPGPAPDGSGRTVQYLKALDVFEISPVIRGAGVRTATLEAKEDTLREYLRFIRNHWCPDPVPAVARTSQSDLIIEQLRFLRDQFQTT